ncbi:MAG: MFS transporter [Desulfocapsaceae bacterium]
MIVDSPEKAAVHNRPVLMVSMLIIAVFFSMGARAVFSPVMPLLQQEMGISLSAAGSLFLFISVSYAVAMLFSGFLSASIGHGRTIVVALATIAVGLGLAAAAPTVMMLAAGMVFIGAGAGIYPPSGIAMINSKISLARRSTAFAFHEIGPNLSLVLCPLLVLIIEPWFGWRGVLALMAVVCIFAALVFRRWGLQGSGFGVAPKFSTMGTILRLPDTYVGILVFIAVIGALHGVYAILPAYLVKENGLSPQYVNALLTISRVSSVLLLLGAGSLIDLLGKRNTMIWILLFTSLFTGLIGLVKGAMVVVVVLAQPALLVMMIPALLSALADIGDGSYQNITYAIIVTAGVTVGGGVVPALLGVFGDFGLGWLGFVALAGLMVLAVLTLVASPNFGRD